MKFLRLRKAEIVTPPFHSTIWDVMKNILGGVGTRLMLKRCFGHVAGCLLSWWSFTAWKMRLLRCGQSCGVVTVVPTEQKSYLLISAPLASSQWWHSCRRDAEHVNYGMKKAGGGDKVKEEAILGQDLGKWTEELERCLVWRYSEADLLDGKKME